MKTIKQTGLASFIYSNKITIGLIIVLIALVKQNIFENNFPYVVLERVRSIDMIKENNVNLALQAKTYMQHTFSDVNGAWI